MNKIFLSTLLGCSLLSAEVLYPTDVKPVFAPGSSEVIGKLLPTNAINVLQKDGDKVKFELKGYQNPAVSNVVYYSNGDRIIAIAFSKTKTPEFELIKKGENGAWDEVKVTAYTTSGDLQNSVDELFAAAKQKYQENCSVCHALHKETAFTPNQWPALFKSMLSRTPIDAKDEWTMVQYLQKTSKGDIK